jgi:putative MATE family efflux protein
MGTQFMQIAYNLADLLWLGQVGSDAVAAAGAAGMYLWLSFGFLLIGRMGAEIGVAQSLGRGDKKTALAYSRNALLIALTLGTLFAIAAIGFNRYLIGFFNFREEDIAKAAGNYLSITGISMPLTFVSSVAVGTYNASGNSRTPFVFNCLGLALNVILDPVFIFIVGMGVQGAAVATIISQFISSSLLLGSLFFYKNRPFERYFPLIRVEGKKIVQLLKWAVPIGVESIMFCFLSMIVTRLETGFGGEVVAISRVGAQIEALSWLIGGGFGSALVAFIGQNYGAKKRDRVRRGVRVSLLTMFVWGSVVTLFFFTLAPVFFAILLPQPELLDLGRAYLFILAFAQLSMNLEAVGSGAFKGTGRTIPPSLVSITANGLKPILAWLLSRTGLGIYGVWIGISIGDFVRGVWVCAWYFLAERKAEGKMRDVE